MTSRLTEIVVDCVEPERLAEFWCSGLHWTVVDRDGEVWHVVEKPLAAGTAVTGQVGSD